ncbi:carbohydrate ABC transporter permease [Sporolactobacillus shoreicorticis]|uniref:Carbohydrate ABC transporter permease n=1 Tax=Sporolactobacillus shoreicorticis TaxID=1923877 RepID=A0ABW5S6U8_9BACL|nr:carbohydrate ABC transporter permease [Sporolactobacillus shoreicorticis]MCO7126192.1 carbohydrate ABC transporter permease [Sporolactobacillus shoreicorticis]
MKRIKLISLYTVLTILSLILFFPMLYALSASFMSAQEVLLGHFFPHQLHPENYLEAFRDVPLLRFLFNSIIISLIVTFGVLIVSGMAAYAFVFLHFRGRRLLFILFISTMMIPWETSMIPNFVTVQHLGWINRYAGLTVPFFASAFGTFLLRQYFKTIPEEMWEAAQISGIGHFRFFVKVVLPVSRTSLVTLGIYTFLTTWNTYLWPLLTTTDERVRPLQIGLRQLQSQETVNDWGVVMAAALIVVVPTLIVLFIGQKHLQQGLTDGALK